MSCNNHNAVTRQNTVLTWRDDNLAPSENEANKKIIFKFKFHNRNIGNLWFLVNLELYSFNSMVKQMIQGFNIWAFGSTLCSYISNNCLTCYITRINYRTDIKGIDCILKSDSVNLINFLPIICIFTINIVYCLFISENERNFAAK